MVDLSKCDYVVETYRDYWNTLEQNIMYTYNNNRYRDYLRRTINPNLTKLASIKYFKRNKKKPWIGDLIYEYDYQDIKYIKDCIMVYEYYIDRFGNQCWCYFKPGDMETMNRVRRNINSDSKTLIRRDYKCLNNNDYKEVY